MRPSWKGTIDRQDGPCWLVPAGPFFSDSINRGRRMLRIMVSRSRLKSVLTGLALYAMAAAMIGYFGVNAYTGKYGLNAQQELDQEIVALTSELARLKRERAEGEQRVSLLRSDRVDPDMLDERARYQLDYVNPHDLVRTNPN
jgi:cell division protein FtsB